MRPCWPCSAHTLSLYMRIPSKGVRNVGFTLEERLLHQQTRPLLSGTDIRALLNHFLPRRDTTLAEVLRQMEVRHRKRQAAIDSAYLKQQLNE